MLRRYPVLWISLSAFALAYALHGIGMRALFARYFPEDPRWSISLQPTADWWNFDRSELRSAAAEAFLPALDSTAGLFNNLVSTFPLAAVAALLVLLNWRGHHATLLKALRKRFGKRALLIHGAIMICAISAILKPFLPWLIIWSGGAFWVQWSAVFAWLAFLFEYLFGVCIQLYLILLAFCWLRGLSFDHQRLLDFAIRRFSLVVRFAALVMIISSLLIDLPLILASFNLLPQWPFLAGQDSSMLIEQWGLRARSILAIALILSASVQITLTFHSESLHRAYREHALFMWKHAMPVLWFLVIALLHFFALHMVDAVIVRGVAEGSLLWVIWSAVFAVLIGTMGAWLLGSWVAVYRRCVSGRGQSENWIQF
jgi:hypothetical protein